MNLKKLSRLSFAELEIAENFRGKAYAFTTVMKGSFVGLGIAVANEPGYVAVPLTFCHSDSWQLMDAHCDEVNRDFLELSDDAAMRIVCSSYAAGPVANALTATGETV